MYSRAPPDQPPLAPRLGRFSLLTTFISIVYDSQMPNLQVALRIVQDLPGFFELVALRNLLLLATVLASICGWWGAHRTPV